MRSVQNEQMEWRSGVIRPDSLRLVAVNRCVEGRTWVAPESNYCLRAREVRIRTKYERTYAIVPLDEGGQLRKNEASPESNRMTSTARALQRF